MNAATSSTAIWSRRWRPKEVPCAAIYGDCQSDRPRPEWAGFLSPTGFDGLLLVAPFRQARDSPELDREPLCGPIPDVPFAAERREGFRGSRISIGQAEANCNCPRKTATNGSVLN